MRYHEISKACAAACHKSPRQAVRIDYQKRDQCRDGWVGMVGIGPSPRFTQMILQLRSNLIIYTKIPPWSKLHPHQSFICSIFQPCFVFVCFCPLCSLQTCLMTVPRCLAARSCIWALGSWHQPLCSWQLQWLATDKSFWHGWLPSQMATFLSPAIKPVVVDHGKTWPIPSSPTKWSSAHQQGLSPAKCVPSMQWARAQWHRPPWHCSKCGDILRDSERVNESAVFYRKFRTMNQPRQRSDYTSTNQNIYILQNVYTIIYIYIYRSIYIYICMYMCFHGVDAILSATYCSWLGLSQRFHFKTQPHRHVQQFTFTLIRKDIKISKHQKKISKQQKRRTQKLSAPGVHVHRSKQHQRWK